MSSEFKHISAAEINTKLLMQVMKVADIFEMQLLQNDTAHPVIMLSPDGRRFELTKEQLIKNFSDINGNALNCISLKYNKKYIVARLANMPSLAVKVPNNSNVVIDMPDGRVVTAGNILVTPKQRVNIEGNKADLSQGSILDYTIFKKTCCIKQLSPELENKLAGISDITSKVEKVTAETTSTQNNIDYTSVPSLAADDSNCDDFEDTFDNKPTPAPVQVQQPKQKPAVLKGSIVCTIYSRANTKEPIGYRILAGGKFYELNKQQTLKLANQGHIENVTAVTGPNGKEFLRGINCSVNDLPKEFR